MMLCEATFDHFSKEFPEMPMLILFTIINMCFDFPISTVPQWQIILPLIISVDLMDFSLLLILR